MFWHAVPLAPGLKQVFLEEFNGDALNTAVWNYETGNLNVNTELQTYTESSVSVANGMLAITAGYDNATWTSGRINTRDKSTFHYGTMEVCMQFPVVAGVFPAAWLLGSNFNSVGWPACGEIDIMEYIKTWDIEGQTQVAASLHYPDRHAANANTRTSILPNPDQFHLYAVKWLPEAITFFVDGAEVYRYDKPANASGTNWPYDHPMFMILNMAIGPQWGPNSQPESIEAVAGKQMLVDWVRVFVNDDSGSSVAA